MSKEEEIDIHIRFIDPSFIPNHPKDGPINLCEVFLNMWGRGMDLNDCPQPVFLLMKMAAPQIEKALPRRAGGLVDHISKMGSVGFEA